MLENDKEIEEILSRIKIEYKGFDDWLSAESRKPLPTLNPVKIDSDRVNDLRQVVDSLPLFGDSAYQFVLSSTEEGGRLVPVERFTKAQLVNQTEEVLSKYDGVNLSWTPNVFKPYSHGQKIDDLGFINAIYLDFDVEKAKKVKAEELPRLLRYLRFIDLNPSLVIDSGHGYYLYWVLEDGLKVTKNNVWAVKKLGDQLKGLVTTMKQAGIDYADGNVSNLNHNLRLPGSVNYKNEDDPRPVKLVHQSGITYGYSDLCAKLTELQPVRPSEMADDVESESAEVAEDDREAKRVIKPNPPVLQVSQIIRSKKAWRNKAKVKKRVDRDKNAGQVASGKAHNKQQNKDFLMDFIMLSKLRGRAIDGHRHSLLIQAYIRGARDLSGYNEHLAYPMNEDGVELLQQSMDSYRKDDKLHLPKKAATLAEELELTDEEASHMRVLVPKELAEARAEFKIKLAQLINTEFKKKIKLCEVVIVQKSRTLSASKLAKQLEVSTRTVQGDKNMDVNELAKYAVNASHETLSLVSQAIDKGLVDGQMVKPEVELAGQDIEAIKSGTKKQALSKLEDFRVQSDEYKQEHARFNRS
ncbi:hypothetical protein [Levilactobacillus tujiorum]|uniref:hypothetical protein n=1 Tax=Levilactobacillus tujiorum TaxID=2912243 RepID=UPI0014576CC4|nr:hypothetical protein [Levilactobacillus tujiorum]NLR32828.1 hypothetical protein [Levilactobacillus tujiorum]